MTLSLLTYNTLFNNGYENMDIIITTYRPDIICFQEVDASEVNFAKLLKYGYKLADYEASFIRFGKIYSAATFFNKKSIKFVSSRHIDKKHSLVGMIYNLLSLILRYGMQKTFLLTDFIHKKTDKRITICNTHLFVAAPNALRIDLINHVLKNLEINKKKKFIIAGDFNYLPYQRRRLEALMKKYGLREATKNLTQTIKFSSNGIFESFSIFQKLSLRIVNILFKKLKIDYIFYKGVKLVKTERIEVRFSDHYPILSVFNI